MSCILRAWGGDFEAQAFARGSSLPIYAAWPRGEPRRPGSSKLHVHSGLKADVSACDFDDLPGQIADALRFLQTHEAELQRLRTFPNVEGAQFDFAIEERDVWVQSDTFPAELLRRMGELGIDLEVSRYAQAQEENETNA